MKVNELIKCLKTCNKGAEVKFSDYCGNWEFYIEGIDDSDKNVVFLVGDHE